ncbi:origin of replication complex subunit 4-like isoform X1 [Zingiber officinale]|uniref:origin of replication complex subunit 4-like isoform X1 n=1 Tax=Zingiber officinale TaxID=94328 RepID=UPI001C4CD000|nr:origin of replication complex subunit 4-like isoform X1 [Zingiber officinale]
MDTEKALALLRSRLYDPNYVHATFKSSEESNYCKLKFLIMNSISDSCNNSILLLGPRGSGKVAVVDLVLEDLKTQHPDSISVIRLNGLLHSDDNFALKEIARQLCLDHQLLFSKMASSDDNAGFMIDMLKECGLSHKSIIFVLDEFDLFAQGKQRLLYSLLDAMQTVSSQAVVIGVSCRLDADQLLEKRVRSRFSHRKLLFVPPSREDVRRLLEHILYLPKDIGLLSKYVAEFNSKIQYNLQDILNDKKFQEILDSILFIDGAINNLVQFLFRAVSSMSLESGLLSLENFKDSHLCYQRQPKTQILEGVSILELYILVCMNRLECKEQNSYNFNSVMKEYKAIHEAYKTSDNYRDSVCLRAFEHLLERELIGFVDNKGRNLSIEIQPVKLLISPHELYLGLKSRSSCPAILQKLFDHESFR